MIYGLIIAFVMVVLIVYMLLDMAFKNTTYYKITHNSLLSTKFDAGRNGEFLTYKYLRKHEKNGAKFLFNCYIPKGKDQTTEIDVLMIDQSGLFVFESKNYSGWIFGSEKSRSWTQTLPQGKGKSRKEHFLNPIMQNSSHIKWLNKLVGEDILMHSVIVFSERCTLKKIDVQSSDIKVIKRNYIRSTVKKIKKKNMDILTKDQINSLYEKLYPYSQVTESTKKQHIENIQNKHKKEKQVTQEKTDMSTIDYYNDNADAFVERTFDIDFSVNHEKFLRYLPSTASILDFGCGSGRDTKRFLELGYQVDAMDGSAKLCEFASEKTGIAVHQMMFQDLDAKNQYDGIWACASVLHLNSDELIEVLNKVVVALKERGILYISLKYGDFEGVREGRYFHDWTEDSFAKILSRVGHLTTEEQWASGDVRQERGEQKWLNLILRKD